MRRSSGARSSDRCAARGRWRAARLPSWRAGSACLRRSRARGSGRPSNASRSRRSRDLCARRLAVLRERHRSRHVGEDDHLRADDALARRDADGARDRREERDHREHSSSDDQRPATLTPAELDDEQHAEARDREHARERGRPRREIAVDREALVHAKALVSYGPIGSARRLIKKGACT